MKHIKKSCKKVGDILVNIDFFLSSNRIPRDLRILNETDTDFIHVDVMDGKFVKNKTMPFKEMRNIYKFTSKRLDVHLMVAKPEKYIKDYATLNTAYLTIHLEAHQDISKLLKLIQSYGIKCGLSIKPSTPIEELEPYLKELDLVLVMSVEPGYAGQDFLEDTPDRIKELKELIQRTDSKAKISVDGGIDDETRKQVNDADIVVSGSYIIQSDNFQEAIQRLR